MASTASASPSAHSHRRTESGEDSDSWQQISSNEASIFFPSPASGSGSMNSWVVGSYPANVERSPQGMSPLQLDKDSQNMFSFSFPDQPEASFVAATSVTNNQFTSESYLGQQQLVTDQDFMFSGAFDDLLELPKYYNPFHENIDFGNTTTFNGHEIPPQAVDLGIPPQFRDNDNAVPWCATNLEQDKQPHMGTGFVPPYVSQHSPLSSGCATSSPASPIIKVEKAPSPIKKVQGRNSKIEKKKTEATNRFVIMTPNIINASAGKPNPYDCFEALRITQRGRKGPLANKVKESALQVRRLGACFCCHARKVKCDKERPCRNCTKLTTAIPQVICWQFQDFLPVLFPDFIREHFKKDQMATFFKENIASFTVEGVEKPCEVELFSGTRFESTLKVKAKFFTAKGQEVLQHWHMNVGTDQLDLQIRGSAPIGIDVDSTSYKDELRKRTRDYIQKITLEPQYAEQVTDSFRHTELPRKVLKIVQRFSQRSDSPMVKKAISIYAMHYVLTRQLCLTPASIHDLQQTSMLPQNVPWLTPRVLNRQVKAMLDDLLLKEMQSLFESFSKFLKPKSRKEWAPCLAAFLVLCLFIEAVETAADTFVISQNEISIRNRSKPEYEREFALQICRELENMPFKQFAYQFHQTYQTHTKDASTKAFNPLSDDSFAEQGELDGPTLEMVSSLKELLQGDSYYELDFLVADPILPNQETHPFPRDISLNYTGRLLARFLLSFQNERYLFDGQY